MIVLGLALISASFFPIGNLAANSQWTAEDSAALDRVSLEYKQANYESPARRGLTPAEHAAQMKKMEQKMRAQEARLERAKSQPKRWSRYLLGIGTLLTLAGFFANRSEQ